MTKIRECVLAAALASAVSAGPASAATTNLVTNGSFENFMTGWSCVAEYCASNYNATGSAEGTREAHLYHNTGVGVLYQDLITVTGQVYDISFWWRDLGDNPISNLFSYRLDGGPAVQLGNPTSNMLHSDSFTAGGTSARIEFLFETDSGTFAWALDDVQVMASDAASAVPLPASVALLGMALSALGGSAAWRRRRG